MTENQGFHVHGWYFKRNDDGSVTISDVVTRTTFDAASWASIIASVSAAGETSASFHAAERFHSSPPAVFEPTGRFEVRDDGAVAEVWEIRLATPNEMTGRDPE